MMHDQVNNHQQRRWHSKDPSQYILSHGTLLMLEDQTPPIDHTGAQWVSLAALDPASAEAYTPDPAHQSHLFSVFRTEQRRNLTAC